MNSVLSIRREKAMSAISNVTVLGVRKETDSLGEVDVPARQRRMFRLGNGGCSGSATADVEATLVHGAQGARSLNIFFLPPAQIHVLRGSTIGSELGQLAEESRTPRE
jgi:hypothetical protein